MKITYGTKIGDIPKQTRYKEWWDDDANEVKEVVNANADTLDKLKEASLQSATVKLDSINGGLVNTFGSPITGTINVDLANAVNGGTALAWYQGPVLDVNSIQGVPTLFFIGGNLSNELCIVTLVFDGRSGGVIVNAVQGVKGSGQLPGVPWAPTNLVLEVGDFESSVPAPPTGLTLTNNEF